MTAANPLKESGVPLRPSGYFSGVEARAPQEIESGPSGVPGEDDEVEKPLQELPPNYAPVPEIASSVRTYQS